LVPPLRDRLDDAALLAETFQRRLPSGAGPSIDIASLGDLASHPWRGNVRELRNFVERAAAFGPDEAIPASPRPSSPPVARSVAPASTEDLSALPLARAREHWDRCTEAMEREYVRTLLARHGHNVSVAADAAKVNRTYLHRLIRKHEL